jgi:signal transduction histidine kinase
MARRIVLTVLALMAALLGLIAVPLGLITAAQEHIDFRQGTVAATVQLANVAEELVGDHDHGPALARSIAQLERGGDQVSVYDKAGVRQAGTAVRPRVSARMLSRAVTGSAAVSYPAGGRLVVLAPIWNDGNTATIGTVALSRSAAPVNHRVAVLWILIGGVSTAGLLAAAKVATTMARWVSRPLSSLGAAAQRLGDGALDTRSPAGDGPTEIRMLATNFNTMAARLEALVHGHQATMADVSHQLRTPLAALQLRLDLLAQDAGEPIAEELAGAQDEIARLTRMVNGLLAVARAENVTTTPVRVAVDTVITDRTAAWRPAAEEREITLTTPTLEPVRAALSEGHLEQILDNLLANALEAVPAGGSVWVTGSEAGARARIVVADDGPGMKPEQQQAAFKRFATATPGGTGLGLAIVHRLVTSNGGSAELSDTPGGGLTVTLELPSASRDRGSRRTGTISA